MLNTIYQPHPRGLRHLLSGLCLALAWILLFSLQSAHAQSTATPRFATDDTFAVSVGFDTHYRDNSWVPVSISLKNDGPDFSGVVSLNVKSSDGLDTLSSPSTYQEAITLASGAKKVVTLYLPLLVGLPGNTSTLTADLLDSTGHKLSSRVTKPHALNNDDLLIGILSDQDLPLKALNTIPLSDPSATIYTYRLTATMFPMQAEALNNFDVLLFDTFTSSSLSKEQLTALQNWVVRGGNVILVGGPEWRRTLSTLPAKLLPVTPIGTDILPARTSLLPLGGPSKSGPHQKNSDSLPATIPISIATPAENATVLLSADLAPLIVQSTVGQGQICYLAFDPALAPLASWSGSGTLWKGILYRSVGDKLIMTNINANTPTSGSSPAYSSTGMSGLLQSLFPTTIFSPWVLLAVLLGYVLLLGPVRYLLVRRLKSRNWSWRIVLCTILVFSALSYGFTIRQKGSSVISSSVSVLQLGRSYANTTAAQVTTYLGVFVPNQGDFKVHLPPASLVQADSDTQNGQSSSQPTVIKSGQGGIDVNLTGFDNWTNRALISKHELQLSGALLSNLVLQNNVLVGTVTNTLPYPLTDAYLLFNNHYFPLGHLGNRETRQVRLPLGDTLSAAPSITLADQIATSKGLQMPSSQGSIRTNQSEQQRHIATLLTLSGENCGSSVCMQMLTSRPTDTLRRITTLGNPFLPRDPLLLPGAAATLIAWTEPRPDAMGNVSINGNATTGAQEAFLQAPLDIHYVGPIPSGTLMAQGQLVDTQQVKNSLIQTQVSGIYVMATGSMTFECLVPAIPKLQISQISIQEPQNLNSVITSAGGGTLALDANHMHGNLYNWRTRSWDAFTLNQYRYSPSGNPQAYIGPGGRVIVQFENQDATQGNILLGTPLLDIQGTVPAA